MKALEQHINSTLETLKTQRDDQQASQFCKRMLWCYGRHEEILGHQAAYGSHQQEAHALKSKLQAFCYHAPSYNKKVEQLIAACFAYEREAAEILAKELTLGLPALSHIEEICYFYPLYLKLTNQLEKIQATKARLDQAHHRLQAIVSKYCASIHDKMAHWNRQDNRRKTRATPLETFQCRHAGLAPPSKSGHASQQSDLHTAHA